MKVDLTTKISIPKPASELEPGTTFKATDGKVYVVCRYENNTIHGKYLFDVEANSFSVLKPNVCVAEVLPNARVVA